jgi:hypothetical protein
MAKLSDEILRLIQAEIDKRGGTVDSIEALNKVAAEVMDQHNREAIQDFEGLSPHQMFLLMHKPFSPDSPVTFKTAPRLDLIDNSPIMQVCFLLIRKISAENGIKLTPKGYLPRKVVNEIHLLNLYNTVNSKHPQYKPLDEIDSVPAAYSRTLMQLAGLVKVRSNNLTLTKSGSSISDPYLMFRQLFTIYITNFHKGYLDGFGNDNIGNVGQLYVIYLLKRYGFERKEASFYASLYFKAFPVLLNEYLQDPHNRIEHAQHCFTYRTFDKGLFMFGLADIEYEGIINYDKKQFVKTTALFKEVF